MAQERGVGNLATVLKIEDDVTLPELQADALALLVAWSAEGPARPHLAGSIPTLKVYAHAHLPSFTYIRMHSRGAVQNFLCSSS